MTRHVIISDLHAGAADAYDVFCDKDGSLLAGFVRHLLAGEPTHLVLNGDVLDLLQLAPWGPLTPRQAATKVGQIVAARPALFRALTRFLEGPGNTLTVVPGNHDLELATPQVWGVFLGALGLDPGVSGRVVMLPGGVDLHVNGVTVRVEHGDACDPKNAVDYDKALFGNFAYPDGSRLVWEVVNPLKGPMPWVNLVTPTNPAVPLLLMALRPWRTALVLPAVAKAHLERAVFGLLERLRGARLRAGGPDAELSVMLADALADACTELNGEELASFLDAGRRLAASGDAHGDLAVRLAAKALWGLTRFTSGPSGFDPGKDRFDDAGAAYARTLLDDGAHAVVMGHTHEALKAEWPDGRVYVNGGCWAEMVRLPGSSDFAAVESWVAGLADGTSGTTGFPTYVEVTPTDAGASLSLNLWDGAGGTQLWAKELVV